MNKSLDELRSDLLRISPAHPSSKPPQWLSRLLERVPGLPTDVLPHRRSAHADLQGAIAAASFHPAIEACLHLINGDLYSAHFLVRKAQGGSRYLDWLHAVLHKLEGDFRNAKMWYTDLGNNNSLAENEENQLDIQGKLTKAQNFRRFHQFWFVPAANGGAGERKSAKALNLQCLLELPRDLQLTAHGLTDLVFLTTLAGEAASAKVGGQTHVNRKMEKYYRETTLTEVKINNSQSAFSLDELQELFRKFSPAAVQGRVQFELVWLLKCMVEDFGWHEYSMVDTVNAFQVESTSARERVDDGRKSKASNMVFNPSQGQRKF